MAVAYTLRRQSKAVVAVLKWVLANKAGAEMGAYHFLRKSDKLSILQDEVCSTFKDREEVDRESTQSLRYLVVVIEQTFPHPSGYHAYLRRHCGWCMCSKSDDIYWRFASSAQSSSWSSNGSDIVFVPEIDEQSQTHVYIPHKLFEAYRGVERNSDNSK